MPKISVIIPVYNTNNYLRKCMDSVLRQKLYDIEIICINDGSTDQSINVLREYEHQDNRVIVIDKTNEGVGKARNDGIRCASGEFICFMDSDDYYPDNNVLYDLYNSAIQNDALVVGGYVLYKKGNAELEKLTTNGYGKLDFPVSVGFNTYKSYQYDYGYTAHIFKRSIIIENNIWFPALSRYQDPVFFVKAMYYSERFYYINRPTYVYRVPEKEMHINEHKAVDMIKGMLENLSFARDNNLCKLYYLTVLRLNHETLDVFEYLLLKGKDVNEFVSKMIHANEMVDNDYIMNSGYKFGNEDLFLVFKYMVSFSQKYYKIRKISVLGRAFDALKKILRK